MRESRLPVPVSAFLSIITRPPIHHHHSQASARHQARVRYEHVIAGCIASQLGGAALGRCGPTCGNAGPVRNFVSRSFLYGDGAFLFTSGLPDA